MVFVVWATITSVLMLVILRMFEKAKVHIFYALIFNYLSAFVCGVANAYIFYSNVFFELDMAAWIMIIMEGMLFITVFYWIAQTTKYYGMSIASVANKMSLVFPVISAHILLNESMNVVKWLGLLMALFAVYMVVYNSSVKSTKFDSKIIYPILVFIGSGIVDSIINYGNKTYFQKGEQQLIFASFVYLVALLTGLFYLKIIPSDKSTRKKFYYQENFNWKNTALLGSLLGIPNFYNLFFIIQALNTRILPGGQIFLILNLSNVIVSALVGVLLFKEKLKWINWLGIFAAICAIILMS